MATLPTPTPWSTHREPGYNAWAIYGGRTKEFIGTFTAATKDDESEEQRSCPLERANALRACACVNACAGIPDPIKALNKVLLLLRNCRSDARESGWVDAAADLTEALRLLGDEPQG